MATMASQSPNIVLARSSSLIKGRPQWLVFLSPTRRSISVLKARLYEATVFSNLSLREEKLLNTAFSPAGIGEHGRSRLIHCLSDTTEGEKEELEYLGELRVPQAWVEPEVAARQAEWLRVALHQWLDDEFCPEPANEEISKRCSKVFYYCLLEQQLDVGDILMQMVRGLETLSFKESFHGAFSSANAAIDLITKRMRSLAVEQNDSTQSTRDS
ncbi:hypothetical protein R1sor_018401 [Riccia sorocarpa]|uniref:Uncharacterized protein n=1 Tax=Riccia sorocarpa TaxID=122646 RepID=A0ABD3ICV6_9MARC